MATRLHWLALVVEALDGTDNPIGIRRWFEHLVFVLWSSAETLRGWFCVKQGPGLERAGPVDLIVSGSADAPRLAGSLWDGFSEAARRGRLRVVRR